MTQATAAAASIPASLGRYELLHEIASGGMATVYLARVRGMAGFERCVAIKRCHPHLLREEHFSDMFLDEARLAARIHHPNVVSALDVGEAEDGSFYLVMELIDGFSLAKLHRRAQARGEAIPVPIALRIMIDSLSGLHAAHELRDADGKPLQLVHRDVSPQNILVGADGVSRITDFGVAKAAERLACTREGHLKGKLSYMAPEQIGLNPTITRQADLYPAGVVLWEMLTGQRLFDGRSDVETLNLVLRGAVRPPSEICQGVGTDIDQVVMRALERDPSRRFESAEEFADALDACSVRPASARAVGKYLQETLAEAFAWRRDVFQRCLREAPLVIERPPMKPVSVTTLGTGPTRPAQTNPSNTSALREKLLHSGRSTTRAFALCAIVAVLGMIATIAYQLRAKSNMAARASTPTVASRPVTVLASFGAASAGSVALPMVRSVTELRTSPRDGQSAMSVPIEVREPQTAASTANVVPSPAPSHHHHTDSSSTHTNGLPARYLPSSI